jgi:hypothetical protein
MYVHLNQDKHLMKQLTHLVFVSQKFADKFKIWK